MEKGTNTCGSSSRPCLRLLFTLGPSSSQQVSILHGQPFSIDSSALAKHLGKQSPYIQSNATEAAVHGKHEAKDGKAPEARGEDHLSPVGRLVLGELLRAQAATVHGAGHRHRGILGVDAAGNRVKEVVTEKAEVVNLVTSEILKVGWQRRREIAVVGAVHDGAGVLELDAFGGLLQLKGSQSEGLSLENTPYLGD